MASRKTRILVLCKTYPSPSAMHAETSCVAGMEEDGSLIRLFPVPFRLIDDEAQFKKWQWITARVERTSKDARPESHRIFVDTIIPDRAPLPTRGGWQARRTWLDKLQTFDDFAALEAARVSRGTTLGLLRPTSVSGLEITPTDRPDWTDDERKKLTQLQHQGGLFDTSDAKSIATLRKVPFDFHYRYACDGANYRHKIVDWEVGALYWNARRSKGAGWESAFRDKIESELPAKDLMFLMGTIHRFPDQWLIVSLIYPPKRPPGQPSQGFLPL